MARELRASGYHWPSQPDGSVLHHKSIASLAASLKNSTIATPFKASVMSFLHESLSLNHSILLSSEEFDYNNVDAVRALRDVLRGFDVTIVFVYREQLAQLNSIHFQMNRYDKVNTSNGTLASTFIFKAMDDPPHFVQAEAILDRYASVFGAKSIRAIDLAGVNAAKKNIAHVMVCEVAGVLCDRADLFHDANETTGANAAYSLVPSQVFTILKSVVSAQGNGTCRFCGPQAKDYTYFATRLRNHNASLPEPLPLVTSRLKMLHPYAKAIDSAFRQSFGATMLYNNQQAAFVNLAAMKVTELNSETFLNEPVWKTWILEEYRHFLAANMLCGC